MHSTEYYIGCAVLGLTCGVLMGSVSLWFFALEVVGYILWTLTYFWYQFD